MQVSLLSAICRKASFLMGAFFPVRFRVVWNDIQWASVGYHFIFPLVDIIPLTSSWLALTFSHCVILFPYAVVTRRAIITFHMIASVKLYKWKTVDVFPKSLTPILLMTFFFYTIFEQKRFSLFLRCLAGYWGSLSCNFFSVTIRIRLLNFSLCNKDNNIGMVLQFPLNKMSNWSK